MNASCKELKTVIEDVLRERSADLEELLGDDDSLRQLCLQLFQRNIVTETTKDNPTFHEVLKEFISGMVFMRKEEEFRNHCTSFVTSLQSLGGPAASAAEELETEWAKQIREKLGEKTQFNTEEAAVFPSIDQFAYALSSERHWYNLGIFLQVPAHELNRIEVEYHSKGTLRCLIEVYGILDSMGRVPSWEFLSEVLRKIESHSLANEIYINYVQTKTSSQGSSSKLLSDSNIPNIINALPPTIDQFVEVLSLESDWYTIGMFLDSSAEDLTYIASNYRQAGIMRCYIEVYKCLEKRGKCLTWDHIATSLRQMGNNPLAEEIRLRYIQSHMETVPGSTNKSESIKLLISTEDLFKCFRLETRNKDRAIELIHKYNNPKIPLKDLVDTKDHNNKTLLMWAGIRGWSDVCELLINGYQCDPLYEDENNWTVLHNVCRNGHIDLVRYFVKKPFYMDPLKKNRDGTTPLNFSKQYNHTDITEYLERNIEKKNEKMHMESFERAVKENGSLTYCTVQCMPFGPPRVGKTCLLKRLLDETLPGKPSTKSEASRDSKSTDVLEERKMIQVRMKHVPPKMIISESGEWKQVDSLEDQTAIIIKSVHSQCKPNDNPTDDNSAKANQISIEDTQSDKLGDASISSVPPVSIAPSSSVASTVTKTSNTGVPVASKASGTDLDTVTVSTIAQALKFKDVDMSKLQTLLSNSLTIFYTDTGGQPEFQEVLPAVVAGPAIFLLIFSLFNGLDSLYEVKYESSPLDQYQAYESSFTVRQVLMQCLASIASYHNAQSRDFLQSTNTANLKLQPPPVKIFTIATHKDLVDSKATQEIDAGLKELVAETVFEDSNLVEPFSDKSMIIPVNNYAPEDGNVVRNVIERVIRREESAFQITIPVPWLGVEIALRQRDSSTISYSECLDVAKMFNIPQHELPDCLWFLHYKSGSIRYYGERVAVLKNVVITKPAIIFSTITEFITSTFVLKKVRPNIQQSFRTRGLFKTSEVCRIFGKHQKNLELLSFDQLLALLQHLNILSKAYDVDFDYFLPCALVHVDPFKDDSLTANTTVLLVLFKDGVVPKGVFSGSLAVLVEKKWIIKRDHNRQPLLFRNQATFFIDSLKCSVTLTSKLNFISVGVNFENEPSSQACLGIWEVLKASLSNVCKVLQYATDIWHFGVYCTRTACKAKGQTNHHSAEFLDGLEKARCTTTLMTYTLEQKDRIWFISSDNSGTPLTSEGVVTRQRKRMHETHISSGMGLEGNTPAAAGGLTPNKSLSDCIRRHTGEVCRVLNISKDSFLLFTVSLCGENVISDIEKQAIMEEKGVKGAVNLLDLVRNYLDGDEDDTMRCDTVMKCFEKMECLRDMLAEMKRDLDVNEELSPSYLENKPVNQQSQIDVVQLESDTSTTANTLIKPQQDEEDDVVKKKLENYDHLASQIQLELSKMRNSMVMEMTALQKLNDPVNIAKTFSDIGIQFNYSVPVANDYIQGAYIAGRMSYTIQGSKPQTLNWDEYGLKMYFPQDTLQHDDNCEVAILALAGGNFRFPKGTELVSAVYAIYFQKKINQRVGIDMEHCVALATERQTTQLHFVATEKGQSQKEDVFEFIEGGQFEVGSKYGYMEQMHFCKKGIVKDSEDSSSTDINYIGCLFYEPVKVNHWMLQFFVYKDIKIFEQFLKKKFNNSLVDQKIRFVFADKRDPRITLTLPESISKGWRLDPHLEPLTISKSDVDLFGSSPSSPPSCMITIYGDETPEGTRRLHHPITLSGIKSGVKKIFIIRSLDEITPATASGSTSSNSQQSAPIPSTTNTDCDTVTNLVSTVKGVFTNNVARLNSLLQDNIEEFAREMLQESLIVPAVTRNPKCTTIIDHFLAKLAFVTELEEIEQGCVKFLKVLHNIGEQTASKYMKKQLVDAVKQELNIDMHLDN